MFGADPVRLSVLATAELLQDAEFSPSIAKSMRDRLERLYRLAVEVAKTPCTTKLSGKMFMAIDRWMISRLQGHVRRATEAMDKLAVRKAIHVILYELDQDFQWYQKRVAALREDRGRKAIIASAVREVLDVQIRMLAPVAPHMCEEIWEVLGGKDFVSCSSWPKFEESKIAVDAEQNEALIMDALEDTQNIINATSIAPKKICYYVAAPWKWKVYLKVLEKSRHGEVKLNEVMRELAADGDLKVRLKEIAKFVPKMVKDVSEVSKEKKLSLLGTGVLREKDVIADAVDFLSERFSAKVTVFDEEDKDRYDPRLRADGSMPCRPAIYIE
jgi:leucyl-tRNA synthetase